MVERGEMKQDHAFGMVLVREVDGVFEVLLVRNWREEWGLPKGHANEGEDPREVAGREAHEETGLMADWVIKGEIVVKYNFGVGELETEKTVIFFVGGVTKWQLDGWQGKGEDGREILECRWCGFREAMDLATFGTTREVVERVMEIDM
jgi:8-oxo-dGTP pyrophosphatase MutT (NUDIX family)